MRDFLAMPDGGGDDPAVAADVLSERLWLTARALSIPVLLVGGLTGEDVSPLFWATMALRVAWAVAGFITISGTRRFRLPLAVDVGIVGAALAASGGAASPLHVFLVTLPLLAGYLGAERLVLRAAAGAGIAAGLAGLPDLVTGVAGAAEHMLATAILVVYGALVGVAFAGARRSVAARTTAAAEAGRRLLHDRLGAEERERRHVSDLLHADALQSLLTARQDLEEGDVERAREGLARGGAGVRATVASLRAPAAAPEGTADTAAPGEDRIGVAVRLAALPTAGALALVGGEPGGWYVVTFVAALLAVGLWLAAGGVVARRAAMLGLVVAFAAGVEAQGGIATELPALLLVLPFLLVFSDGRGELVLTSAAPGVALALLAAEEIDDGTAGAVTAAAVLGAAYAWAIVAGALLAGGRARIQARLEAAEQVRRAVLAASLEHAAAERLRLADGLRDGALIAIEAAELELERTPDGSRSATTALLAALLRLRMAVAALHPPALEHGGLGPALQEVVRETARAAGLQAEVSVDERAGGEADELLVALVRQLAANVAAHAQASTISVAVQRHPRAIELTVLDDGIGALPADLDAAPARGRIGLASARERVRAAGGTLRVRTGPGLGFAVVVTLHVRPLSPAQPLRQTSTTSATVAER